MKITTLTYIIVLIFHPIWSAPVPTDPDLVTSAANPVKVAETVAITADNPVAKTAETCAKTEMAAAVTPAITEAVKLSAEHKTPSLNPMKNMLNLSAESGLSREVMSAEIRGLEHMAMPHEFSFGDEANRFGDAAVGVAAGFDTAVHAMSHLSSGFPFIH